MTNSPTPSAPPAAREPGPSRRILLFTVGTLGDLLPVIALGQRLRSLGHAVTVTTHGSYQARIEAAGLTFAEHAAADPRKQLQSVQHDKARRGRLGRLLAHFAPVGAPDRGPLDHLVQLAREHDVLLSGYGLMRHAAEGAGIPFAQLGLYPLHATGAFPNQLTRCHRSLGGPLNRLTHWLVGQHFWRRERTWVNDWRAALKLGPLNLRGRPVRGVAPPVPCFYGFSPTVLPKPTDWPADVQVTGFWFTEAVPEWQPPEDLQRFLAAGEAPVVLGFGSLVDRQSDQLLSLARAAAQRQGRRLLVLSGWLPEMAPLAGDDFHRAEFVPLSWLLPRAALLIHHGGAGTLAEVLRAGTPSVTIPSSGEQRFWAWRLHAIGAAPAPLLREDLTADRLSVVLADALQSPALRERRQVLSQQITQEDGLGRAVRAIDAWLAGLGRRSGTS